MTIYHDPTKGDTLTLKHRGYHRHQYAAEIGGWYAGGFSAKSDTEALKIFRRLLGGEEK